MAIIRMRAPALPTFNPADLAQELAAELRREPQPDEVVREPIVIENEMPGGSLHVAVIWSRWKLVDASERSRVIMNAYEQVARDRVDAITIAMPATPEQADRLGLLPYEVVPVAGALNQEREADLMRREGALEINGRLRLRFPNLQTAAASHARLVRDTSPNEWELLRIERGTPELTNPS